MSIRKPIVVYRERYLPISETFIYEQIKHLQEYKPYVLCKEILPDAKRHFPHEHIYFLQDFRDKAIVLRRRGIRVIYARFGMGGVEMLPLKRAARLPMLTSFHGSDVSRQLNKRPDYREALPALFAEGERFTVVCEHMKNKLIDLGCPAEKIAIIKSGIDLKKFPFCPKLSIEQGNIRILSVGRLTEKKGMDDLVLAFTRVASVYPRAKLVIIGDGEERPRLESMIWSLGLERHVELLGRQNHEKVQEEMKECNLFVLASRIASDGNEEGIPNVIMEAMATGRLVIATKHAGIPELVKHEITGYLVQENAPHQLGGMMLKALKNQEDWSDIIAKGREMVEEEHNVHKQIRKLEAVINEIIPQGRVRARRSKVKRRRMARKVRG
ncbi:glycosyltransferase [Ammoniphilus sp. 3BR4]|uniref:glycosyltransferase n=1 Tax=Ammoniphilus sp. 3BR4 TaxID=3158265 RepID=UPI0034669E0D